MSSGSWPFANLTAERAPSIEYYKAHRERLAFEAEERAQQRKVELTEQASILNTPEARIRMWEKVHQLRLPMDPMHAIIDVVAAGTGLTASEVREEQRARVSTHETA
jgi:hypothetical protein